MMFLESVIIMLKSARPDETTNSDKNLCNSLTFALQPLVITEWGGALIGCARFYIKELKAQIDRNRFR